MSSKMRAIRLLGHTEMSRKYRPGGMGEIAHTSKIGRLFKEQGFEVIKEDIFALFGELYEPLATLNYDLADGELSPVEEVGLEEAHAVYRQLEKMPGEMTLMLSLSWSLGALLAVGVGHLGPLVSKLYVHQPEERVLTSLYAPTTLLVTESLLASEVAIEQGIPPWKIVYLPHTYPKMSHQPASLEHYAREQGREVGPNTVIVGVVSRLCWGKNCEFALEVVEKLVEKGADILLYLKGDFDPTDPFQPYNSWLKKRLDAPWLLWDRRSTPFPKVLEEYAACDLFLQLSGAEAGSNVVVELMGLGKPVVVLEASTHPSLFCGGAVFVKVQEEMRPGSLHFRIPDEEDLLEKVEELVSSQKKRQEVGEAARALAQKRFSHEKVCQRLPLIFEAACSYYKGKESLRREVEALYMEDRREYGL